MLINQFHRYVLTLLFDDIRVAVRIICLHVHVMFVGFYHNDYNHISGYPRHMLCFDNFHFESFSFSLLLLFEPNKGIDSVAQS